MPVASFYSYSFGFDGKVTKKTRETQKENSLFLIAHRKLLLLQKTGKDALTQLNGALGIEMQAVGQQREIGSIDDKEMGVLLLYAVEGVDNLLTAHTAALGVGATDDGEVGVPLLACHRYEVLADMLNDGFQIVVVAVGSPLVTLALMPDEHLDIVVLRQVGQAVVNLTLKGFQQGAASVARRERAVKKCRVGTPVEAVGARLARRVDSRTAIGVLDDIERPLPQLLETLVDDGVEAPAPLNAGFGHTGREGHELACSRLEVAAAIAPQAVLISLELCRQFGQGHPSVGIRLAGSENHGNAAVSRLLGAYYEGQ